MTLANDRGLGNDEVLSVDADFVGDDGPHGIVLVPHGILLQHGQIHQHGQHQEPCQQPTEASSLFLTRKVTIDLRKKRDEH